MPTKKSRYTIIIDRKEKMMLRRQQHLEGFYTLSDLIRSKLGLQPLSPQHQNQQKKRSMR